MRPRALLIAGAVVAVQTAICAGVVPGHLKRFRELFADFGAELPWLSHVALEGAWIWPMLTLASFGIAAWIASARLGARATFRRMWVTLVAYAALFVAVFLITLIAVYLPIFRLGAVV